MKTSKRLALAFARGVVRGFARQLMGAVRHPAARVSIHHAAEELCAELTPPKRKAKHATRPAVGKKGGA